MLTFTALTGNGIAELWEQVLLHRKRMTPVGRAALQRRREQQVKWMWSMLEERLFSRLKSDAGVRARLPAIETAVAEGRLAATLAVEQIAAMLEI